MKKENLTKRAEENKVIYAERAKETEQWRKFKVQINEAFQMHGKKAM